MKLNLGCGQYPLEGFTNLDKIYGWTWESGLPFENESIQAITISHSLCLVDEKHYQFIFSELNRVLSSGGIIRITEDDTENPLSPYYKVGWDGAITLTSIEKMTIYCSFVGLQIEQVSENETHFKDMSLCQSWHGGEPKVFFMEAIKL